MSTTFFIPREQPPDAAAVIEELDRPALAANEGRAAELRGRWPDKPVLFWEPGRSARGVEVCWEREQARMTVRIMAMSSSEDYELAFRLIEVIGGNRIVESEAGDPLPARDVRAAFGGAWMRRDMAASAAAIRAGLATGKAVVVSGPLVGIEIAHDAAFDPDAFVGYLRQAQAIEWKRLHPVATSSTSTTRKRASAIAVVLDHGRVSTGGGSREEVFDLLDTGTDGIAARVERLSPPSDVFYRALSEAWFYDHERRELHLLHTDDEIATPPLTAVRSSGVSVRVCADGEAFAATLGDRGITLPPWEVGDRETPWGQLVDELFRGDQERLAVLRAQERERSSEPIPGRDRWFRASLIAVVLATILLLVPALVVRLLTWPLRPWLRRRRQAAAQARSADHKAEIVRQTARLRGAPEDVEARRHRVARFVGLGRFEAAERDLAACLAGSNPEAQRAELMLARANLLRELKLPRLAEAEEKKVRDLGHVVRHPAKWRVVVHMTAGVLSMIAGLMPE